ncbi:hypothetical protein Sp14A_19640 [Streptococcus pluranimalium]|uniref:Uncharacterized protein n=1 Tax=Streptococcus pluranimalium TaxID=82348 RepID=A0A345VM98_9STRE|nr:hypothetical protein Sp14A_19640 [Streptococcus pluranimalium]
MAKWMGFFLSEHTTSLVDDKERTDFSTDLSKTEKLTLIGQLYAGKLKGRFTIKGKKKATLLSRSCDRTRCFRDYNQNRRVLSAN